MKLKRKNYRLECNGVLIDHFYFNGLCSLITLSKCILESLESKEIQFSVRSIEKATDTHEKTTELFINGVPTLMLWEKKRYSQAEQHYLNITGTSTLVQIKAEIEKFVCAVNKAIKNMQELDFDVEIIVVGNTK